MTFAGVLIVNGENIIIKTIAKKAFYDNDTITSVTIPDSVTTIGDYAFFDCDSLTTIYIPNSVTRIEEYAFSHCSSLTSIYISNSVITIGQYAFRYCSNLTIYCEVSSQPSDWDSDWNYSNCPVVWNTTYDDYLASIA